MSGPLTVLPERTRGDRRAFLGLPYRLNRGLAGWVAPLRIGDATLLDRRKNPFFEHGDAAHFLARRGGRVVGRIAAIENRRHNDFHGDRLGFFGWFACEDDPEAARGLVDAARGWVEARGLLGMRGPVSYTMNDACGVLVDGFERRAGILMPWNPPHYDALLRGAGLAPVRDLLAYDFRAEDLDLGRLGRISERRLTRSGCSARTLDMKRWPQEVDLLLSLYNRCWERNWGFVPMTEAEFRHAAKDLKMILDPRIFFFLERGGEAVGFIGIVPDLNVALDGLDGRLFPFGLFRLLARRRRIRRGRIMLLGVAPEVRGQGVQAALMVSAITAGRKVGYEEGEASWILEDNAAVRSSIESMGVRPTKRYRMYEAPAAAAR